jgi:hypothetical protein
MALRLIESQKSTLFELGAHDDILAHRPKTLNEELLILAVRNNIVPAFGIVKLTTTFDADQKVVSFTFEKK